MKKIIITVIFVIGAVILGINGKAMLQNKQKEIKNEKPPVVATISVEVIKPKSGFLENKEGYIAQIESVKSIKLSTKLAGYIEKVYVQENQKIKKNQILVKIDDTETRSNIDALYASLSSQKQDLELARSIYNRNKELYKIGGLAKEKLDISKVTLDIKSSIIENTKQKIAQLKHQLSYLKIVAPFDGYIDSILLHEGDLAAAGKPILAMSNGQKKLIFSYAPTNKTDIKTSQVVYLDNKEIGYVKSIYTTSQNGLISAEVALTKNISLPTGSNINIEVQTKKQSGCIIPNTTVLHKKDGVYVMAYDGKTFSPFKVKVEMKEGNTLLISPCPSSSIAKASETKLAQLPAYDKIDILEGK